MKTKEEIDRMIIDHMLYLRSEVNPTDAVSQQVYNIKMNEIKWFQNMILPLLFGRSDEKIEGMKSFYRVKFETDVEASDVKEALEAGFKNVIGRKMCDSTVRLLEDELGISEEKK